MSDTFVCVAVGCGQAEVDTDVPTVDAVVGAAAARTARHQQATAAVAVSPATLKAPWMLPCHRHGLCACAGTLQDLERALTDRVDAIQVTVSSAVEAASALPARDPGEDAAMKACVGIATSAHQSAAQVSCVSSCCRWHAICFTYHAMLPPCFPCRSCSCTRSAKM